MTNFTTGPVSFFFFLNKDICGCSHFAPERKSGIFNRRGSRSVFPVERSGERERPLRSLSRSCVLVGSVTAWVPNTHLQAQEPQCNLRGEFCHPKRVPLYFGILSWRRQSGAASRGPLGKGARKVHLLGQVLQRFLPCLPMVGWPDGDTGELAGWLAGPFARIRFALGWRGQQGLGGHAVAFGLLPNQPQAFPEGPTESE